MSNRRDVLLSALRDAYAMERYAERLLRIHAAGSISNPDVNVRIEAHLLETLAYQKSLASCIARIDESGDTPRALTDDSEVPVIQTRVVAQSPDELVTHLQNLYSFKHQEIASYTSLIAIAEASGFFETKIACETIILQQIAMANWLLERLSAAATAYLGRDASQNES
jgi:ferritin-like metal-binding protein YciE